VRSWPIWRLPSAALTLVLVVDAAAVAFFAWSAVTSGFGGTRDLIVFGCLIAAGLVCVEVIRRMGEPPRGLFQDLMTVWTLPIALLLPAPFAVLAPVPDRAWAQWRIRRGALYRRVFSTASIGLTLGGSGRLFHALAGGQVLGAAWGQHTAVLLPAAMLAGCTGAAANTVLVAAARRLSTPDVSWAAMLADRDMLVLSAVEVSTGLAVTVLAAQSPALIVVALPPMILLHRSLWHAQLTAAARTDTKTGLLNATAWHREVERDIDRAARDQRDLSVLLIDLDRFKTINDAYGHLVGDRVLAEVADLLGAELRSIDILARFGGDEFAVAVTGGPHRAKTTAERLRHRIAGHRFDLGRPDGLRITASIGIATLHTDGIDPTELLAAADAAMYAAKAAGRNRTIASVDLPIDQPQPGAPAS